MSVLSLHSNLAEFNWPTFLPAQSCSDADLHRLQHIDASRGGLDPFRHAMEKRFELGPKCRTETIHKKVEMIHLVTGFRVMPKGCLWFGLNDYLAIHAKNLGHDIVAIHRPT